MITDKELEKVAEIIIDVMGGADCDICPCSFTLGDCQDCMRKPGEQCLQTIKRKVKEELENVQSC